MLFQTAIDFQIIILIICHTDSFLSLSSGSLKTFPCRVPHKRLIWVFPLQGGELRQHKAGGDPTSSSAPGRDMGPSTKSSPALPGHSAGCQQCQGVTAHDSSAGWAPPAFAETFWNLEIPKELSCSSGFLCPCPHRKFQVNPSLQDRGRHQLCSSPAADMEGFPVELSVTDLFTISFAMPLKCAKQDQEFFPRICTDKRCNLKRLNSVYLQPKTNQEEIK